MTAPDGALREAPWGEVLRRESFIELDARGRAGALLDAGSGRELCGPFDRVESPWLEPQGIVPQADDGVVVVKGTLDGEPTVVVGIEQAFQGGGTGEVSGMKISAALSLAAADNRAGVPTAAVLLLETGGVRLQEANLGLAAVAEICSALLELRAYRPVIGVVTGTLGSFGGMSIAAGLCTRLVITREGRIGLNGPQVIEQEAGIEEFDSGDRALIWSVTGGEQRYATGLADDLVPDDVSEIRRAVAAGLAAGLPGRHRSQEVDALDGRLAGIDPSDPPPPPELRNLWGRSFGAAPNAPPREDREGSATGRGWSWTAALADEEPRFLIPSVVQAHATLGDDAARLLAVVPDPENPYYRARGGEVGLRESLVIARAVREVVEGDEEAPEEMRQPIVAVVDLRSQAYGKLEETFGIHQTLAAAVDAYSAARVSGHPVVALVVGSAFSGGFLAHGLQANRILALDDPGVEVHAMHREAAARVTRRTVEQLDELAEAVPPLSYDVRVWARLGLCDGLLRVENPDHPTKNDVRSVRRALVSAIEDARRGPRDLRNRLESPEARRVRAASLRVGRVLGEQWG